MSNPCPCGLPNEYHECCGRFIDGKQLPITAEQLMRSRYTAYTQANISYIQQTMSGPPSEGFDTADATTWAKSCQWQGLKVKRHQIKSPTEAYVTFIASYEQAGTAHSIKEKSKFLKMNGKWVYVGSVK